MPAVRISILSLALGHHQASSGVLLGFLDEHFFYANIAIPRAT